jgi:hypothetical protein
VETADCFHFSGKTCQKGIFEALQTGTRILLSDTHFTERLFKGAGAALCGILEAGKRGYIFESAGKLIIYILPAYFCGVEEESDRIKRV